MQTIEHILRVDSSENKIFGQIRSNISLWQTIWVVPYQGVTPWLGSAVPHLPLLSDAVVVQGIFWV